MTSQYVKCDGCDEVVDRLPPGLTAPFDRHGTFGKLGGHLAREYARSIGWKQVGERDFCPKCAALSDA